jgi:hypothetical protein
MCYITGQWRPNSSDHPKFGEKNELRNESYIRCVTGAYNVVQLGFIRLARRYFNIISSEATQHH